MQHCSQFPRRIKNSFRSCVLLVSLVASILFIWNFFSSPSKEPSFEGEKLSEWIRSFDAMPVGTPFWTALNEIDRDPEMRKSKNAVAKMGTNALPLLLRVLASHPDRFTKTAKESAARAGILKLQSSHFDRDRIRAVCALVSLEVEDRTKAIPDLLMMIRSPNWGTAYSSATVLASMGGDAQAAVPKLVSTIKESKSVNARSLAILALSQINPKVLADLSLDTSLPLLLL